ncbi:MAG TPA: hypothetical protein VJT32_08065 [bacterium]|nr:hypothetical protein [bacterium]
MTTKLIDQLDAESAATLRLVLMGRSDMIDRLYPEVGSPERMEALGHLIHLIHELGLEIDGLLSREDN